MDKNHEQLNPLPSLSSPLLPSPPLEKYDKREVTQLSYCIEKYVFDFLNVSGICSQTD